jgi:uncharacterized membrane protein YdjX (TVP38/TMEM64 family)
VSPHVRLAIFLAGVGTCVVLVAFTVARSPEEVRTLVDGYGALGPVIFVVVAAFLSCSFFPGPLLAGAAGLLFGTALGTPVAMASGVAAAALAFTLARHGARPLVERKMNDRVRRWRDWIDRKGFLAVLYARIAPGMPFAVVNYTAGLTRLPILVFLGATVIGIAPRSFAYAALGGHLDNLSSPEALIALGILVGMGVGGLALVARDRRRGLTRSSVPPGSPSGASPP